MLAPVAQSYAIAQRGKAHSLHPYEVSAIPLQHAYDQDAAFNDKLLSLHTKTLLLRELK
jgi:hypothetical protein